MLVQFESARKTYGGNVRSSAPRYAPGARRNLMSSARAAFVDVCAVLAAVLVVSVTGIAIALSLFFLLFCKC